MTTKTFNANTIIQLKFEMSDFPSEYIHRSYNEKKNY
jgi:hypothetical protein